MTLKYCPKTVLRTRILWNTGFWTTSSTKMCSRDAQGYWYTGLDSTGGGGGVALQLCTRYPVPYDCSRMQWGPWSPGVIGRR